MTCNRVCAITHTTATIAHAAVNTATRTHSHTGVVARGATHRITTTTTSSGATATAMRATGVVGRD